MDHTLEQRKEVFPTVLCPCGCGRPATEGHHGTRTAQHREWCRWLKSKGILSARCWPCGSGAVLPGPGMLG